MSLKLKALFLKYRHAIPLIIYAAIYMVWFVYLEKTVTKSYHVIHMDLDNHIPFVPIFVVPYLLWFIYVASVVLYLFFTNKEDYYKCCLFLFTGMTIFLIVSTIMPNGHHLRPHVFEESNIFTRLIQMVYAKDTSTNLWPSIHVYNSIGAHLAITQSKKLSSKKILRAGSFILSTSIIFSTVLIKQHSIFDVITAFIMAIIMYFIVYPLNILNYNKRSAKSHIKQEQ